MDQRGTFFTLMLIFVIVQLLGIYCGYQYLQLIKAGEIEGAFQDPESVSNSLELFVYILLMTGVLILIIRFKKSLLRVFEAFAILFASMVAFDFLMPYWLVEGSISLGMVLAIALTAWKMRRPTILNQNIALIFALSGAGAILGGSLGILPIIVFLMILSIYDFISVFWTKHMVYLAKAITERPMAFTAAVPLKTKNVSHVFQLGGGDLVMPMILSVSVLGRLGLYQAALTTLGALIALGILFAYVLKHPGEPLPALPPVSAGACLGLVAGVILFGV